MRVVCTHGKSCYKTEVAGSPGNGEFQGETALSEKYPDESVGWPDMQIIRQKIGLHNAQ